MEEEERNQGTEVLKNILITSVNKQLTLTKEIIKKTKETNADRKVYTCDMYPESVSDIVVGHDGCFKVPICTSEDYVETIFSICVSQDGNREYVFDPGRLTTKTRLSNIIEARNRDEECLRLACRLAQRTGGRVLFHE